MSLLPDSNSPSKRCSVSPSYVKRSKLNHGGDYAEICGKSDCSGNVKKARFLNGAVIAAAPLRNLPSDYFGEKLTRETVGKLKESWKRSCGELELTRETVGQLKESWERSFGELEAVLGDAKRLIYELNVKNSEPIQLGRGYRIQTEEEDCGKEGLTEEDDGEEKSLGIESEVLVPDTESSEKGLGFESEREDDEEKGLGFESMVLGPDAESSGKGIESDKEYDEEIGLGFESEIFGLDTESSKKGFESEEKDDEEKSLGFESEVFGLDAESSEKRTESEEEDEKCFGIECEEDHDEQEVQVLSPGEWIKLPFYHKEKCNSHKSNGNKTVDFVDLCYYDTKFNQQSEYQEQSYMDFDSKNNENHVELINLQIGKHEQPQHADVMETLKLFQVKYDRLKKCTAEIREGKFPKPAHTEAGEFVKDMGMCVSVEKPFGHIPGIEIGDAFRFRVELAVVGLHGHFVSGINYVHVDGKVCATSVVESGQYENTAKTDDVLIYSGQGGNPKLKGKASDQKLERGNLSLVNSMEMGFPVRVISKRRNVIACRMFGTNNVYVYDGLYSVNDFWQERGEHGKQVFKFELRRLPNQPGAREANAILSKTIKRMDVCVMNDVSQGKEKFSVRVVNGVDDELPPPFTYITKVVYPYWFQCVEPIGCNCIDGCSNLKKCHCVLNNGNNVPFNEHGAILGAKPRIHECGPSCKCPPSCMNRVSQHGPCYQLEIFRTEARGWGVRSRNYISKGSFVCEYIGELLRVKEVQSRVGNDEHLFYIQKGHYEGQGLEYGFALDSTTCGNIGRFINHKFSPNLIAKEVFYDHDDKRVPHIMFFASKNIGHSQELTYDYTKTRND